MSSIDAGQWTSLSGYLDRALDLPEAERQMLVEELRRANAPLAARLEALLESHRAVLDERFLEVQPAMPVDPFIAAGQELGAYRLVALLGRGGMGSVWQAERTDGRFERKAAIKFLHAGLVGRDAEQRFRREGRLLARLTHPNIAHLIDAGVTSNCHPYLVLEHVDGESIDQYCDRNRLGVEARLQLFLDMSAAVSHAHGQLIVHRDLKPSNVLVTSAGDVKLLDFGIATLADDDAGTGDSTRLTHEGAHALTPEWAAPEQVSGEPVSTATDVHALGGLLYLLLTGHHPMGAGRRSPAELVKAIVEGEPARMSSAVTAAGGDGSETAVELAARRATTPERLRRRLKGDLDTIVHKALKKDPAERYASAEALADDVRRVLAHEPIGARPDSLVYRASRFARRHRTAVTLGSLAILALVAGIVGTLHQARVARAQRDFAVRQLAHVEAVDDLIQFLLSDAAPSGKPITVNDLLAQAERIVGRQRGGNDALRADMLVSIGRQYLLQDEQGRGGEVLQEAYDLSRKLEEPSTRARAACALASASGRGGELSHAQQLVREGLDELPDDPQFAFDRAFCLLRGGEVSREQGAAQQAIERAEEALLELKRAPYRSEMLELRAFMELAESHRSAGDMRAATSAFEQAAARLVDLGRDETATAGTLYNNWGLSLARLGQHLDAEQVFRRAIELSRTDATDEAVSPMLLINYARNLRDLGRLDEAAAHAERGNAKARSLDYETVVNQSLLLLASIYRQEGALSRAGAALAEVEPRLRTALPPGHIAFAALASEHALLAQARGDLEAALDLSNQALGIARRAMEAGGQGADYLPGFLVRRSRVEADLGQLAAAESDARAALELLQAGTPAGIWSTVVGSAYLALGRTLEQRADRSGARDALQSAVLHLENAAGREHPETVIARELLGDVDASD